MTDADDTETIGKGEKSLEEISLVNVSLKEKEYDEKTECTVYTDGCYNYYISKSSNVLLMFETTEEKYAETDSEAEAKKLMSDYLDRVYGVDVSSEEIVVSDINVLMDCYEYNKKLESEEAVFMAVFYYDKQGRLLSGAVNVNELTETDKSDKYLSEKEILSLAFEYLENTYIPDLADRGLSFEVSLDLDNYSISKGVKHEGKNAWEVKIKNSEYGKEETGPLYIPEYFYAAVDPVSGECYYGSYSK